MQSHAITMRSMCGAEAAEMIDTLAGNYCGQRSPVDQVQLGFRMRQQPAVSGLIGTITHADTMARLCPKGASKILEAARAECLKPIPQNDEELKDVPRRQAALSAEIDRICAEHR
jgi:hypothetical protein